MIWVVAWSFWVSVGICTSWSQNRSNLKGLHPGRDRMSSHSLMGQWADPWASRMWASKVVPSIKWESKMRKRSSRKATWWAPNLRFMQVKSPFGVFISMRPKLSITPWNFPDSTMILRVPPLFSSRLHIKLKSPPRIHLLLEVRVASPSRFLMKAFLSLGVVGP